MLVFVVAVAVVELIPDLITPPQLSLTKIAPSSHSCTVPSHIVLEFSSQCFDLYGQN